MHLFFTLLLPNSNQSESKAKNLLWGLLLPFGPKELALELDTRGREV